MAKEFGKEFGKRFGEQFGNYKGGKYSSKYKKAGLSEESVEKYEQELISQGVTPPDDSGRSGLDRIGSALSVGLYPVLGAIKNVTDTDENTTAWQGVTEGLKASNPFGEGYEKGKTYFSDLLTQAGWESNQNPDGVAYKPWTWDANNTLKGAVGFVGDVALDPLTYLTGVGGVLNAGIRGTGKTIAKTGARELAEASFKEGTEALAKDNFGAINQMLKDTKLTGGEYAGRSEDIYNKVVKDADMVGGAKRDLSYKLPFAPESTRITFAGRDAINKVVGYIPDKTYAPLVNTAIEVIAKSPIGDFLKKFRSQKGVNKEIARKDPISYAKQIVLNISEHKINQEYAILKEIIQKQNGGEFSPETNKVMLDILEDKSLWSVAKNVDAQEIIAETPEFIAKRAEVKKAIEEVSGRLEELKNLKSESLEVQVKIKDLEDLKTSLDAYEGSFDNLKKILKGDEEVTFDLINSTVGKTYDEIYAMLNNYPSRERAEATMYILKTHEDIIEKGGLNASTYRGVGYGNAMKDNSKVSTQLTDEEIKRSTSQIPVKNMAKDIKDGKTYFNRNVKPEFKQFETHIRQMENIMKSNTDLNVSDDALFFMALKDIESVWKKNQNIKYYRDNTFTDFKNYIVGKMKDTEESVTKIEVNRNKFMDSADARSLRTDASQTTELNTLDNTKDRTFTPEDAINNQREIMLKLKPYVNDPENVEFINKYRVFANKNGTDGTNFKSIKNTLNIWKSQLRNKLESVSYNDEMSNRISKTMNDIDAFETQINSAIKEQDLFTKIKNKAVQVKANEKVLSRPDKIVKKAKKTTEPLDESTILKQKIKDAGLPKPEYIMYEKGVGSKAKAVFKDGTTKTLAELEEIKTVVKEVKPIQAEVKPIQAEVKPIQIKSVSDNIKENILDDNFKVVDESHLVGDKTIKELLDNHGIDISEISKRSGIKEDLDFARQSGDIEDIQMYEKELDEIDDVLYKNQLDDFNKFKSDYDKGIIKPKQYLEVDKTAIDTKYGFDRINNVASTSPNSKFFPIKDYVAKTYKEDTTIRPVIISKDGDNIKYRSIRDLNKEEVANFKRRYDRDFSKFAGKQEGTTTREAILEEQRAQHQLNEIARTEDTYYNAEREIQAKTVTEDGVEIFSPLGENTKNKVRFTTSELADTLTRLGNSNSQIRKLLRSINFMHTDKNFHDEVLNRNPITDMIEGKAKVYAGYNLRRDVVTKSTYDRDLMVKTAYHEVSHAMENGLDNVDNSYFIKKNVTENIDDFGLPKGTEFSEKERMIYDMVKKDGLLDQKNRITRLYMEDFVEETNPTKKTAIFQKMLSEFHADAIPKFLANKKLFRKEFPASANYSDYVTRTYKFEGKASNVKYKSNMPLTKTDVLREELVAKGKKDLADITNKIVKGVSAKEADTAELEKLLHYQDNIEDNFVSETGLDAYVMEGNVVSKEIKANVEAIKAKHPQVTDNQISFMLGVKKELYDMGITENIKNVDELILGYFPHMRPERKFTPDDEMKVDYSNKFKLTRELKGSISEINASYRKKMADQITRDNIEHYAEITAGMSKMEIDEEIMSAKDHIMTSDSSAYDIFESSIMNVMSRRAIKNAQFTFTNRYYDMVTNMFGNKVDDLSKVPVGQNVYASIEDLRSVLDSQKGKEEIYDKLIEVLKLPKDFDKSFKPFVELDSRSFYELKKFKPDLTVSTLPDHVALNLKASGRIQIEEKTNVLLDVYDKMLNTWKINATAVNPGFHVRNAISNVFNNYLNVGSEVLNPRTNLDAIHLLGDSAKSKAYRKSTFIDTQHGKMDLEKVRELYEANRLGGGRGQLSDVFGDGKTTHDEIADTSVDLNDKSFDINMLNPLSSLIDIKNPIKSFMKPSKELSKKQFLPYTVGRKAGQYVEGHARALNFIANLKLGNSVLESADNVNKFLFNYNDLTEVEKTVMKRIIPFYTWMRKNMPLQLEHVLHNPSAYNKYGFAKAEIEKGVSEEDKIKSKYKNEFSRDWIQTPFMSKSVDKKGKTIKEPTFWNPSLPLQDLAKIPMGAGDVLKQFLTSASPLIKLPVELASNKNTYFGTPISQGLTDKSKAPGYLQALLGGTTKKPIEMSPEQRYALQNLAPSLENVGKIIDTTMSDDDKVMNILKIFGGQNLYNYNAENYKEYSLKARTKVLKDLLKDLKKKQNPDG